MMIRHHTIDDSIDDDRDKVDSTIDHLTLTPLSLSSSSCSLSSSQFAESNYHLKSSIPSTVLFLVGSILYMELSRMDLIDADYYYEDSNDDDNDDTDNDYYENPYFNKFTIMSIFGALLFVVNAIWDIYWCFGREREWKEKINAGYASDDEEENEAYHREEQQNFYSALAFGTAGSIDLATAFIQDDDIVANITVFTSNLYLLSAVLALKGTVLSCPSIPTGFALVGDILFALGSLIDVAISFISDPEFLHLNSRILAQWSCLSSSLWLMDALLYFTADMTVIWYRRTCCCVKISSAGGEKINVVYTLNSLT